MSASGIVNLMAFGVQDAYITGNPEITWWKFVYKKYTNFGIEDIDNHPDEKFTWGGRQTILISRCGDLISRLSFEITLPDLASSDDDICYVKDTPFAIIKYVSLQIQGQEIEHLTSEWLHLHDQLHPKCSSDGSIGPSTRRYGYKAFEHPLIVDLPFYFTKSPGLSLPLIALQYHEVKVVIAYKTQEEVVRIRTTSNDYDRHVMTNYFINTLTDYNVIQPNRLFANTYTASSGNKVYNSIRDIIAHYADTHRHTPSAKITDMIPLWASSFTTEQMQGINEVAELTAYLYDRVVSQYEPYRGTHKIEPTVTLVGTYIFLTSEERRAIASQATDHLVMTAHTLTHDISFTTNMSGTSKKAVIKKHLAISHPTTEIVVCTLDTSETQSRKIDPFNYKIDNGANSGFESTTSSCFQNLTLNISNVVVDQTSHNAYRLETLQQQRIHNIQSDTPFAIIPFTLDATEYQPKGSMNMSRCDNVTLDVRCKSTAVEGTHSHNRRMFIHSIHYNVLHIEAGMGGMRFA